jgi:hypothetical protein
MTYEKFKQRNEGNGESVMMLAFFAVQIDDDPELKQLAEEAIEAEDKFDEALRRRGFNRG